MEEMTFSTVCEKTDYRRTSNFKETIDYYRKLSKLFPQAQLSFPGSISNFRKIPLVEISDGGSGPKFTLLIQNCIHAGEPEGNDATMILAREILTSPNCKAILEGLRILILPILNVEGHLNYSKYHRVNQSGPLYQGWRTNNRNLNLNRDYLKADSDEIKFFLSLVNKYKPDLFVDNHTTNGLDYQYHISYSIEKEPILSPELTGYAHGKFLPFLQGRLTEAGILHTHYIELMGTELEHGLKRIAGMPRLSTGYMALRNRIGLLVETHSLKPFENRIKSTLEINRGVVEFVLENREELMNVNNLSEVNDLQTYSAEKSSFAVNWETAESFTRENFAAFKYITEMSQVTGAPVKKYTDIPEDVVVPVFKDSKYLIKIKLPEYYAIPKTFWEIHKILNLHGFKCIENIELIQKAKRNIITSYSFASQPYEGRFRIKEFTYITENKFKIQNRDYYLYSTAQVNPRILGFLLNLRSPESFFQWGFFNAFFERKEYAEDFVFEPIAKEMLDNHPELRILFNKMLEDETFRDSPAERLDFFYKRSLYCDNKEGIYPVFFI